MNTPLPLPEIVHPSESFERVMLPGLTNPRNFERHETIPNLVSSRSLDKKNEPSPIERIKLRHHTSDAIPSYHGSLVRFHKEDSGTDSESEAEKEVHAQLAKATTKKEASKQRKENGKKRLSIKDHSRSGTD